MSACLFDHLSPAGCRVIFVKNLPYDCDEDGLRTVMSAFGEVQDVRLATATNGVGGAPRLKGFGYVQFKSEVAARKAATAATAGTLVLGAWQQRWKCDARRCGLPAAPQRSRVWCTRRGLAAVMLQESTPPLPRLVRLPRLFAPASSRPPSLSDARGAQAGGTCTWTSTPGPSPRARSGAPTGRSGEKTRRSESRPKLLRKIATKNPIRPRRKQAARRAGFQSTKERQLFSVGGHNAPNEAHLLANGTFLWATGAVVALLKSPVSRQLNKRGKWASESYAPAK